MRFLKVFGLLICLCAFSLTANASDNNAKSNNLGIRDSNHVTFSSPVRVGSTLLPAGDYTVRHQMDGADHIMIFQGVHSKDVVKVKCTLVPLAKKAPKDEEIVKVGQNNERVLEELTFHGESAKHVF
jgi:hypothetical protein